MDEGSDIDIEGVVAVGPHGSEATVDIDMGVAHGAVEDEGVAAVGSVGNIEGSSVETFAYVRKSAGAAGLPRSGLFAVLLHGDFLKVVFTVKRAIVEL